MNKDIGTRDAIFQIIDRRLHIHTSPQATNVLKARLPIVIPFFVKALKDLDVDNISFVLNLCDSGDLENVYNMPYICLTKDKRSNHKLIPNIDFFSGLMIKLLNESSIDKEYDKKKNQSCFVGSSTNGIKRIKYCYDLLDSPDHVAKISNLCQVNKDEILLEFPKIDQCLSSYIDIKSQLDYKILVNIDGNSVCWSRLYWQMNSNSIPVYIDKHPYNIQYYDQLMPEDCYFSCTFDNYLQTFAYILSDDNYEEVNRFNMNGQKFCRDIFSAYLNNPEEYLTNIIKNVIVGIAHETL